MGRKSIKTTTKLEKERNIKKIEDKNKEAQTKNVPFLPLLQKGD
jgi:hypothetical protein